MRKTVLLVILLLFLTLPVQADEWIGTGKLADHGFVMAMDGSTLVIGNPVATGAQGQIQAGEVKVYTRDTMGAWVLTQTLTSDQPGAYGGFGWSLDINGKWMVIGEPFSKVMPGRAHIYKRTANGTWKRHSKVAVAITKFQSFGWAVSIEGKWLAVSSQRGERGFVMVYQLKAGKWTQVSRLTTPDTAVQGQFGYSLKLRGGRLLVGQSNGAGSIKPGAAYFYARGLDGKWVNDHRLYPSHLDYQLGFGSSVDIDGESVIVGAPRPLRNTAERTLVGAAYVYTRSQGAWVEEAILTPTDLNYPYNNFAALVALNGNTAVLATHNVPLVHVFERQANGWVEKAPLLRNYLYTSSVGTRSLLPNGYGCGIAISDGLIAACSGRLDNPYARRRIQTFRTNELIVNGGFELPAAGGTVRQWTQSAGTMSCNSLDTVVAHSGNCAFSLAPASSLITQTIPPKGIQAGDRLVLRAAIRQTSVEKPNQGFAIVYIPLADGTTARHRLKLMAEPKTGYVMLKASYTLQQTPAAPLTVDLFYRGSSTGILVDDVRLTLVRTKTATRAWIELP